MKTCPECGRRTDDKTEVCHCGYKYSSAGSGEKNETRQNDSGSEGGENQPETKYDSRIKALEDLEGFHLPQFLGGFLGWFVINTLLWLPFTEEYGVLAALLIMPANILALIILAIIPKTRMIAYGLLTANAVNLVFTLLLGIFINSVCFAPFYIDLGWW